MILILHLVTVFPPTYFFSIFNLIMTSVLKDILDSSDLISHFVGISKSILFSQLIMEDKLLWKNSRPMSPLNLKQVQTKKKLKHIRTFQIK